MKSPRNRRQSFGAVHAAVVAALVAPVAVSAAELEEVVVSAQKRVQRLEQVPLAVTALSGDDLAKRGVNNFSELVDAVPGVSINYAFGGPQYGLFSIRGIGGADDYKPNGSPSVALHVDGVYQTSNAYLSLPLFDVERLEILKGPQGTLYGRNTTAGVVNAITRNPGAEFAGYAQLLGGSFERIQFEAAAGGPLSEATGVRLALHLDKGGGFMEGMEAGSLAGFQPTIGGVRQTQVPAIRDPGPREGFGDKDLVAARATVTHDFSESTALWLKAFGSHDRGDTRQYDRLERARDNTVFNAGEDADPYKFYSNQYYTHEIDVGGLSGQLTSTLAVGELTVLAAHQQTSRKVGGNGDGTPYPQFEYFFDEELEQSSIEARLAGEGAGAFRWIAGAFWLTDDADFGSRWTSLSVRSVYVSPYVQERDSRAIFGQLEYDLDSRWRVLAGARFTQDEARFVGSNRDLNPWGISTFAASFTTTNGFAWDQRFEDDNLSGRLTLQYSPSEEWSFFLSGGTGYRSGGFDGTSIFTVAETLPMTSETVRAYEGGARWTTSAVRLAVDAFGYWFKDLHATTRLSNDTNGRTNVGRAWARGVDVSLSATLFASEQQSLEVSAAAAWLDTKITEFRSNRVADVAATVGDPLPGAPDLTASLAVQHRYRVSGDWSLLTRLGASHHGEESNRLNALPNNTTEAYSLVDARLELSSTNGLAMFVYGRNLGDEVYFPELNGASRLVGEPRTYGVGLRYTF